MSSGTCNFDTDHREAKSFRKKEKYSIPPLWKSLERMAENLEKKKKKGKKNQT